MKIENTGGIEMNRRALNSVEKLDAIIEQIQSERPSGPPRIQYLDKLPNKIPDDMLLVHNHVMPAYKQRIGTLGFTAWLTTLTQETPALEGCLCGWARKLGPHCRIGQRP